MKNWLWAMVLVGVGVGLVFYFNYSPRQHSNSPENGGAGGRLGTSALPNLVNTPSSLGSGLSPGTSPSGSSLEPRLAIPNSAPAGLLQGSASTSEVVSAAATTNLPPNIILENMRTALRDFGSRFGGNPVGNNAEITRALEGENPKQVKFLREDSGLRTNSKGELVDSWGTPFFFHQLSGTETEIRSAGPDKIMWTADDLVTK